MTKPHLRNPGRFAHHICAPVWMLAAALALPVAGQAQNYGSSGESWSSTWGFASAADRTLMLQQAQAIRQATQAQGPSTVVTNYTTNDNRQNYQQIDGGTGGLGNIDFHMNGDRIGQNTNTVGSMNTGTTNVEITGTGNTVHATNAADSSGCLDGSIALSENSLSSFATPMPLNLSLAEATRAINCTLP